MSSRGCLGDPLGKPKVSDRDGVTNLIENEEFIENGNSHFVAIHIKCHASDITNSFFTPLAVNLKITQQLSVIE